MTAVRKILKRHRRKGTKRRRTAQAVTKNLKRKRKGRKIRKARERIKKSRWKLWKRRKRRKRRKKNNRKKKSKIQMMLSLRHFMVGVEMQM